MTANDLRRIDDLLTRTENLPDILHIRAAKIGYQPTDEEQQLLVDTYQKLDDILKEVAAFINVKFPGRQDYIHGWNKIDFDTKIGGVKIITTDREHVRRDWKKGLFDLKGLLKSLRNEVVLLIEDNPHLDSSKQALRANNFSGNIIYNEGRIIGNQHQSSVPGATSKTPSSAMKAITKTIIAIIVSVIGGLIIWYLTTKVF